MAKIFSEQLRKVEKVEPFGHSEAPKKYFFWIKFAHFSRPVETGPYVNSILYYYCVLFDLFSALIFHSTKNIKVKSKTRFPLRNQINNVRKMIDVASSFL